MLPTTSYCFINYLVRKTGIQLCHKCSTVIQPNCFDNFRRGNCSGVGVYSSCMFCFIQSMRICYIKYEQICMKNNSKYINTITLF